MKRALLGVAALAVASCNQSGTHAAAPVDGATSGTSDMAETAPLDGATDGPTDGAATHYQGGAAPTSAPEAGMAGGATIPATVVDANSGLFVSESLTMGVGTYRIVWKGTASGAVVHHHFTGSIWTTSQPTNIALGCNASDCALEPGDYIGAPVDLGGGVYRIDFDTDASDGLDGLELQTSQSIIYIDVAVDGTRAPSDIFYPAIGGMGGAPIENAPADPVKVITS